MMEDRSEKILLALKRWEPWFWILLAFVFSGRMWFSLLRYGVAGPNEFFELLATRFYPDIIAFSIFLIFPRVYFKIFGDYPIRRRARRTADIAGQPSIKVDEVSGDLYVTTVGGAGSGQAHGSTRLSL